MFRQFTENFVMENANVTVPVVLFRVYWLAYVFTNTLCS